MENNFLETEDFLYKYINDIFYNLKQVNKCGPTHVKWSDSVKRMAINFRHCCKPNSLNTLTSSNWIINKKNNIYKYGNAFPIPSASTTYRIKKNINIDPGVNKNLIKIALVQANKCEISLYQENQKMIPFEIDLDEIFVSEGCTLKKNGKIIGKVNYGLNNLDNITIFPEEIEEEKNNILDDLSENLTSPTNLPTFENLHTMLNNLNIFNETLNSTDTFSDSELHSEKQKKDLSHLLIEDQNTNKNVKQIMTLILKNKINGSKYPIAYFEFNSMNANKFKAIIDETIKGIHEVQKTIDESVISQPVLICFDGASSNRKFVKEFSDYCTKGVYRDIVTGFKILIVNDKSHIVKRFRNTLYNNKLSWDGFGFSWKILEELFEKEKNLKISCSKLSANHIILTSKSKMNVGLASHIFSSRVQSALEFFFPKEKIFGLMKYLKVVQKFKNIMNCKEKIFNINNIRLLELKEIKEELINWGESNKLFKEKE